MTKTHALSVSALPFDEARENTTEAPCIN